MLEEPCLKKFVWMFRQLQRFKGNVLAMHVHVDSSFKTFEQRVRIRIDYFRDCKRKSRVYT